MKFNWGHGIVTAFILFISFIGYFVWRMSTDPATDHELVTHSYYQEELRYQEEIDALKASQRDGYGLRIEKAEGGGLRVEFPAGLNHRAIEGTVSLYRPSDRHLDSDLPLDLSNPLMLIPDSRLLDGRWDIRVDWAYAGTRYLYKETIYY